MCDPYQPNQFPSSQPNYGWQFNEETRQLPENPFLQQSYPGFQNPVFNQNESIQDPCSLLNQNSYNPYIQDTPYNPVPYFTPDYHPPHLPLYPEPPPPYSAGLPMTTTSENPYTTAADVCSSTGAPSAPLASPSAEHHIYPSLPFASDIKIPFHDVTDVTTALQFKQQENCVHRKTFRGRKICETAAAARIYFIQRGDFIVSPDRYVPVILWIGADESTPSCVGAVEVESVWRLRLKGSETSVVKYIGVDVSYVFIDDSTKPDRIVILQFSKNLSISELTKFESNLLRMTSYREEKEGTALKITDGVDSVYTDITKKLNSSLKEATPSIHKNTKWLRQGANSLVRLGGTLFSKGIHVVGASLSPSDVTATHNAEQNERLMAALCTLRNAQRTWNGITYI